MTDFIRLIIDSSWCWRYERWLTHSGTTYLTGFRRRNLGRFLLDDDDVDYDEVPLCLWNRVPLIPLPASLARDAAQPPEVLPNGCAALSHGSRRSTVCQGRSARLSGVYEVVSQTSV